MDNKLLWDDINQVWDKEIIEELKTYITIPNQSPHFDPQWQQHGHMERAVTHMVQWCEKQGLTGGAIQVKRLPGRTPLLYWPIRGEMPGEVLLYGHLDKQPPMQGWDEGKGPWTPVLQEEKLYGRGSADDGYALYAAVTAIKRLQEMGIPHPSCRILIEASEESGSHDLVAYLDELAGEIPAPDLIVCLDSGCGDFERLWCTNSLRGNVTGTLNIDIMKEGIHSGKGSGVVPSWFDALSQLVARIQDPQTGQVKLKELHQEISPTSHGDAEKTAKILQQNFLRDFALLEGVKATHASVKELLLNQSLRPALTVTGIEGVPKIKEAGNVSHKGIKAKLSLRTPPLLNAEKAAQLLKEVLEKDPPHGVQARFIDIDGAAGWMAPPVSAEVLRTLNEASQAFFHADAAFMGEGGSIPFMGMLGAKYPKAQFIITGVLGPRTNAHGPNEFLHIPTAKKVTACISYVLAHFKKSN